MKILVTGGAGFIGSNIVDAYIDAGHRVVVIDNFFHGFKKNLNPKATLYRCDIRNLSSIKKIIKKERPAVINHHAALAAVVQSTSDPVPTMEVNVQGTVNLLLAGGEEGVKKFIFASTGGAIYGNAAKYPITELAPTAPLSPYGLSKLLAEECIIYYARQYNFQYLIFRYPNVYGPRQDPHGEAGVVAIFTQHLRHGQQPTIFGDGSKTRDYVYVKDIVQANLLGLGLSRCHHHTLNLGLGKEITDDIVYQTIARHFSHPPKVRYRPFRPGEAMRSSLAASRAKRLLHWQPRYTFMQGVTDYMKGSHL